MILQEFIFALSSDLAVVCASAALTEENVPCDRYAHELSKSDSCKLAFELSQDCIVALGLKEKVAIFEHKIAEAQRRLGASYKIRVRIIGSLMFTPYYGTV